MKTKSLFLSFLACLLTVTLFGGGGSSSPSPAAGAAAMVEESTTEDRVEAGSTVEEKTAIPEKYSDSKTHLDKIEKKSN